MFLERLEAFSINMKTLLMVVRKSVMESVLVKLQAITMNGNARVCGRFSDRICFSLKL